MYKLDTLTSDTKQYTTWTFGDEGEVELYFEYRENQLGWFLGVKYQNSIDYKNIRLSTHPNILRAFKNTMPFGMMITTLDGLEPMGIDDFESGYCSVYMLSKTECELLEGSIYAKTQ